MMQVKKFEAPTMQEAINVIKKELGPDAIILSTKENKRGFGLMSKNSVEVTAAISKRDLEKKQIAEKDLPDTTKSKIWQSTASEQKEIYDNYFEKQLREGKKDKVELSGKSKQISNNLAKEDVLVDSYRTPVQLSKPKTQYNFISDDKVTSNYSYDSFGQDPQAEKISLTENLELKRKEESTNRKIDDLENEIRSLKDLLIEKERKSNTNEFDEVGDNLKSTFYELIASGIDNKNAKEIVRKLNFSIKGLEISNQEIIKEKTAEILLSELKTENPLLDIGAKSGVANTAYITIVGPTGVGKTTSIAKIASHAITNYGLRVGLINLDSYKVAAADQLSTYAKIMNVPFRSVSNEEELSQAVYDFGSLDLVLIDTTGRSQQDQDSLIAMKKKLDIIENKKNILMVSATTRDVELIDICKRFKIFDPKGLIISKLDEAGVFGCIYNTHKRTKLPLNFFTVGQRVPEDLEIASSERVADLVLDLDN